MLGIELKDAHLELWPKKEDAHYIDEFLKAQWLNANQRLIGINLSASQRWLTKNWPLRHITKLCEELSRQDFRVVITGTEEDMEYADKLINIAKDAKLINACGKTSVNQLVCLIKRCSVYITSDSAPLHIAASQGIPLVALFGPTDPGRHIPPVKDYIVLQKELPCSPCYKSRCKHKECMEKISPAEVLEAINNLLK